MKFLLAVALGMALVLAVLSSATNPGAAQLAAERTAQVQAQEAARTAQLQAQEAAHTERVAIQEAQRTERAAEREATLRMTLLLLIVVAIVIIVAGGAVVVTLAWLRRPALPAAAPASPYLLAPPPHVVRIAAHIPGGALDYDPADGWIIIEPDGRYLTIADAARLLTSR